MAEVLVQRAPVEAGLEEGAEKITGMGQGRISCLSNRHLHLKTVQRDRTTATGASVSSALDYYVGPLSPCATVSCVEMVTMRKT
mmetsp:Transcript_4804/g.9166  ORF Transcript_4804/g.9166 Transcript_4804/m.9166 type:complete len:84 (-) Transcript_4804:189-440(-)